MSFKAWQPALVAIVICATLIPRLMLIGAPPATDEGIYAFNTLMIHMNPSPGAVLPDLGSLSLYQAMLAWVFSFDINHFVMLRLMDAVIASLAGIALYQVIKYESASKLAGAVIAVVFLLTMNDPVFIQYGNKNSIAAASLPLLTAIALGQRTEKPDKIRWLCVGALVAVSVLLREPFAVFSLAGLLVVYLRAGREATAAFAIGGGFAGGLILLAIVLMRGGYSNLIQSYADLSLVYEDISYQKYALLQSSPIAFANNATSILLLSAVSMILILYEARKNAVLYPRLGFWLLLAVVPLLEPLLKNGYPYHYASTLFGLAGLVALAWRVYSYNHSFSKKPYLVFVAFFAGVLLLPKFVKYSQTYSKYTSHFDAYNLLDDWPESTVKQSNYLMIAEHIRTEAKGKATVAINGSMLGVIPLAKARPSRPDLAHLSYSYLHNGKDANRLRSQIYECPPEFILLTNSSPFKDTKVLSGIVNSIPEYRLSTYIPPSYGRHYGSFDGAIFKWTGMPKPCRKIQIEGHT